jgi:hypothetical protein
MDWINLAEDRDPWREIVNAVMNILVPKNGGNFFNGCIIGRFSRRAQLHKKLLYLNDDLHFGNCRKHVPRKLVRFIFAY